MARPKKRKAKSKTSTKRISTMHRPHKRRRRKTLNYTLASPRRRSHRRRRAHSLSAGPRKAGIVKSLQNTALAGFGGVTYLAPKIYFKNMALWQKATWGILGSVGLHMLKYPTMANGFSGALFADISKDLFPTFLSDAYSLEGNEYVDADTLSDSGQTDQNGNPILISDSGSAYALNDDNELEELNDAYSLNDPTDMNTLAMVPLQDPYSLSQGNTRYGF